MFLSCSSRMVVAARAASQCSAAQAVARRWMATGTVWRYSSTQGYGFIRVDHEDPKDHSPQAQVFVHKSSIVTDVEGDRAKLLPAFVPYLRAKERVQFDIEEPSSASITSTEEGPAGGQRKPKAINVRFENGDPIPAIRRNYLSRKANENFLGRGLIKIMQDETISPEEKAARVQAMYERIEFKIREREHLVVALGLNPDDYRPAPNKNIETTDSSTGSETSPEESTAAVTDSETLSQEANATSSESETGSKESTTARRPSMP